MTLLMGLEVVRWPLLFFHKILLTSLAYSINFCFYRPRQPSIIIRFWYDRLAGLLFLPPLPALYGRRSRLSSIPVPFFLCSLAIQWGACKRRRCITDVENLQWERECEWKRQGIQSSTASTRTGSDSIQAPEQGVGIGW